MFLEIGKKDGQWFPFRMSTIDENTGEIVWGDPIEGMEVQIRSWRPFFDERISKRPQETIWKVHPKSHAYEPHTKFKDLTIEEAKQERQDAQDYAITGLRGFKDKKTREEYPCTREVKLGLLELDFFDRFFIDCQQRIDSYGIEMEKAASENLSKPQNG